MRTKKIFSVFPSISFPCDVCQETGKIDEDYFNRLAAGKKLKEERAGLSLREFCQQHKIDPIKRSQEERGILIE